MLCLLNDKGIESSSAELVQGWIWRTRFRLSADIYVLYFLKCFWPSDMWEGLQHTFQWIVRAGFSVHQLPRHNASTWLSKLIHSTENNFGGFFPAKSSLFSKPSIKNPNQNRTFPTPLSSLHARHFWSLSVWDTLISFRYGSPMFTQFSCDQKYRTRGTITDAIGVEATARVEEIKCARAFGLGSVWTGGRWGRIESEGLSLATLCVHGINEKKVEKIYITICQMSEAGRREV